MYHIQHEECFFTDTRIAAHDLQLAHPLHPPPTAPPFEEYPVPPGLWTIGPLAIASVVSIDAYDMQCVDTGTMYMGV